MLSFSHVVQQDHDWKIIQESISKHATVNKTSFENMHTVKKCWWPKKREKNKGRIGPKKEIWKESSWGPGDHSFGFFCCTRSAASAHCHTLSLDMVDIENCLGELNLDVVWVPKSPSSLGGGKWPCLLVGRFSY